MIGGLLETPQPARGAASIDQGLADGLSEGGFRDVM